ncbi:MAG: diheme cytochrome c-553 [Chitinophagaceae bacterium]
MRTKFFTTGTAIVAVTAIIAACTSSSASKNEVKPMTQSELVKRGEYLVNAVGCDDCHSPKKMGPNGPEIIPDLRFSGYPSERPVSKADTNTVKQGWMMLGSDLTSAAGPWGMSFSANITGDATGIGNWKEEQFFKAIREGKSKGLDGNRPLLPPMPWFVYKNFSDDDIRSIFTYLKSTKPVHNVVPAPRQWSELK